ncbi:MAG: precorrin-3B C(17)-methyltransferase [Eubacteriales bacterium]|nr:precorrin-3B C(17)-methyltransferase [Eubacteriales bacterium]
MKRIYVVGIGPGDRKYLTGAAARVLEECQVIVGYTAYVDLLKADYPEKIFLTTPMKQETERCRMAFEEAAKGMETAMVCSGDSGIYGMAGLMYQIGQEYPEVDLIIVPGITAASAGAAVLGAPLMHDFAVISLSDLLTPWEKIEKRLIAAAMADFVICLYNPSSRKRADYLERACDLILQYKSSDTVCGLVRNIGRMGETYEILPLGEMRNKKVDMFTTVYIGNRETREIGGKMITPRGYRNV